MMSGPWYLVLELAPGELTEDELDEHVEDGPEVVAAA